MYVALVSNDCERQLKLLPQAISQRLRDLHLVLSLRRLWNQTPPGQLRPNHLLRIR